MDFAAWRGQPSLRRGLFCIHYDAIGFDDPCLGAHIIVANVDQIMVLLEILGDGWWTWSVLDVSISSHNYGFC
jgi:hypothetical protein